MRSGVHRTVCDLAGWVTFWLLGTAGWQAGLSGRVATVGRTIIASERDFAKGVSSNYAFRSSHRDGTRHIGTKPFRNNGNSRGKSVALNSEIVSEFEFGHVR